MANKVFYYETTKAWANVVPQGLRFKVETNLSKPTSQQIREGLALELGVSTSKVNGFPTSWWEEI